MNIVNNTVLLYWNKDIVNNILFVIVLKEYCKQVSTIDRNNYQKIFKLILKKLLRFVLQGRIMESPRKRWGFRKTRRSS